MVLAAVFAAGCNAYYDAPDNEGVGQYSQKFVAFSEDWAFTDLGEEAFYEIGFPMSAITRSVCEAGTVSASLVEKDDTGADVYFPLTEIRPVWDNSGSYMKTISHAFKPGWIYFKISYSDFNYSPNNPDQPGDHTFRVVITY